MNDFPRMLYKAPGVLAIHGGLFATAIVDDQAAMDDAAADGWCVGTDEAKQAKTDRDTAAVMAAEQAAEAAAVQALADETRPPSRNELEQMATSLALVFHGNTSDKKLTALIKAASEA